MGNPKLVAHVLSLADGNVRDDMLVLSRDNRFIDSLNNGRYSTSQARERYIDMIASGKKSGYAADIEPTNMLAPPDRSVGPPWAEPAPEGSELELLGPIQAAIAGRPWPQTRPDPTPLVPPPMDQAMATHGARAPSASVSTQTKGDEATPIPPKPPRPVRTPIRPAARRPRPQLFGVAPPNVAGPLLPVATPSVGVAAVPQPAVPAPTDLHLTAAVERLERELAAQRVEAAGFRAELNQVRQDGAGRRANVQNDRLTDLRLLPRLPDSWQTVAAKWPWEHIWHGLTHPSFDNLLFMAPKATFSTLLHLADTFFLTTMFMQGVGMFNFLNFAFRGGFSRLP